MGDKNRPENIDLLRELWSQLSNLLEYGKIKVRGLILKLYNRKFGRDPCSRSQTELKFYSKGYVVLREDYGLWRLEEGRVTAVKLVCRPRETGVTTKVPR